MALTTLAAPTIAIAEAVAAALASGGFESYSQGWLVRSIAGESKVASTIATIAAATPAAPRRA